MTSTSTGNIVDDMLAYASNDDYMVTRNLLYKGANEILRLRSIVDKYAQSRIPPCSGHAYQQNDCQCICTGSCNRGVGK